MRDKEEIEEDFTTTDLDDSMALCLEVLLEIRGLIKQQGNQK